MFPKRPYGLYAAIVLSVGISLWKGNTLPPERGFSITFIVATLLVLSGAMFDTRKY